MSNEKIYLGMRDRESVSIEKHEWQCGWYWAFGYMGNNRSHWHFDSLLSDSNAMSVAPGKDPYHGQHDGFAFEQTWLSQSQWWILRDLFSTAYALKAAAAAYRYGGHQTEAAKPYRVTNAERAAQINADLKTVLDNVWQLLTEWRDEHNRYVA